MPRPFLTLDVFTDRKFGGNPLAIFPDSDDLDTREMQLIAREFNMSEVAFLQTPSNSACDARVRIFTSEIEIGFAGHPNVGVGWYLAGLGGDGVLRLEQGAGIVEVAVDRTDGKVSRCRIGAPKPLVIGQCPPLEDIAACAGLAVIDIEDARLASVGLSTICVRVSPDALRRAKCSPAAFQALAAKRPDLAEICLLYLYVIEGTQVKTRMFAPLSGTIEDPATGSAACALTASLLDQNGDERLSLDITQGVEMGRPSHMVTEAVRVDGEIRASVSGSCVAVTRGELL